MRIARPYLLVLLLAITWLAHLFPTSLLAQGDWGRVMTFLTDKGSFRCLHLAAGSNNELYLLATFHGTLEIGGLEYSSEEYADLILVRLSEEGHALGAVVFGSQRDEEGHSLECHEGQVYVSGSSRGELMVSDSIVATSQDPQFGFIIVFTEHLEFQRVIIAHGPVHFGSLGFNSNTVIAAGSVTAEKYSLGATEFTSAGKQLMLWAAFDVEGALVWSDTAGPADPNDPVRSFRSVEAVKVNKNGDVYSVCTVVSSAAFTNGFSVDVTQRTTVVTRHSLLGDLEWVLQVGGDSSYCIPGDIAVTDSSLFVCGGILGKLSVHDSVYLQNSKLFGYDGFVLRMTHSGIPQWATHLQGIGLVDLRAIQVMDDGTSITAGQFDGNTITINGRSRSTATPSGGFLARLRPNGSTESIAIAGLSAGESDVRDACTDSQGTSHMCGAFNGIAYFNDSIMTGGSESRGYLVSASFSHPTTISESYDAPVKRTPIAVAVHEGCIQIRDHHAESPLTALLVHTINGQRLSANYTITSDHTAMIHSVGMTSQGFVFVTLHRVNGTVEHAKVIWTP